MATDEKLTEHQKRDQERGADFVRAAEALILRRERDVRPRRRRPEELEDWSQLTEAQRLALQLVPHLLACFTSPGAELTEAMARFLSELEAEPGRQLKRARCVDAIAHWAGELRKDEWQPPEARALLVKQLVDALEAEEPAFAALRDESDWLLSLLSEWAPRGKAAFGRKSAERILAEVIASDLDALGLGLKADESEADATERIRKVLDKAAREKSTVLDHASKQP